LADAHDNQVISLSGEGAFGKRISRLGVPVTTLNMQHMRGMMAAIFKLYSSAHLFSPDIIQGWMYHGNIAAYIAQLMLFRKPMLCWNIRHCLYSVADEKRLTQNVIKANKYFSAKANSVIYNSQLALQQHKDFGFCCNSELVIPNGFDLNRFKPSSEEAQLFRLSHDIPQESLLLGHVGRFHEFKDHGGFIKAATEIMSQNDKLHAVLAGQGVKPEKISEFDCVPKALRHRFHWLGEYKNMPSLMSALDILCQSSKSEAFPNVLGEAMASGVPCVATDVGDSSLIVGDSGIVVRPSDRGALINGLKEMIALSYDERKALGRTARMRIGEYFSLKSMCKSYEHVYESITAT
jgi:glycosyltransferase involved in cell wall biosynthesis